MTRSPLTALLAVATAVALGGCRAATLAYGPDAATARANADAVASAMQDRFTNVLRTPKFAYARMRIARYAVAPSKLVNDTSLWTSARAARNGNAERDLDVGGEMKDGRYTFTAQARVAEPLQAGDSRDVIRLRELDHDGDWHWLTSVEHAVGAMPPERATDVFRALFASSERPSADVRADYRAAFPRTAQAMGRMFSLDSVLTTRQADGSTLVALHIVTSDARLQVEFPEMAKFVRKYFAPSKYHIRLIDRANGVFFDATSAKQRLVVRFRSLNGELQPIDGPARRMPDTLAMHVDSSAKSSVFTVGFRRMVGEFVHTKSASERGWVMRFAKEPDWDLPLLAEQLMHSPLRRPFEGQGVQLRVGFSKGAEGQTIFSRVLTLVVRESAIMRFLGNLGFTAISEFAEKSETDTNRFLAEAFAAMRADIQGIR